MKKLQVNLSKNQRILFLIMAAIFLPQGIRNVVENDSTFNLVLGVLQISLALFYIPLVFSGRLRVSDPAISPVLLLGPKAISIKSWWHPNKSIDLAVIDRVQLKPERALFLSKTTGKTLEFNYSGPNMAEIRNEIQNYCTEHQLEVEEIGYR